MSQITDQVKDRIDLAELVREYVPELKKAGVSWKARCPFHQEKTPSFVVSPEKQIWHCFGCGKGGDAFGFIKEIEGLEFADALRELAKRAGVKLVAQDPQIASERGRLYDILRLSARWYQAVLQKSKSAGPARDYLSKRQVKPETADKWLLGYAPEQWDGLSKYLGSRGYREAEIEKAGLASRNERGNVYDRFRGRLMFPIFDGHGNALGFSGRKLKEEDLGGKYINTPETLVYHKSDVLYGLSFAKEAIRRADLAVIVEGNMDCLSSHQAGVVNAVAASGTALTLAQIKLIKRFTKNIALAFDPDAAGQSALLRGLEIAWQEDMNIKVISLPAGQDPDAVARESAPRWQEIASRADNFMDWLFAKAEKELDLASAEGKKKLAKAILPWLVRLPDIIEQTHYLQILAAKIKVEENILRRYLPRHAEASGEARARHAEARPIGEASQRGIGPEVKTAPASPAKNIWEKTALRFLAMLAALGKDRETLPEFSPRWLPNEKYAELYNNLNLFYDNDANFPLAEHSLGRELLLTAQEQKANLSKEEISKEANLLQTRLRFNFLREQLLSAKEKIKQAEKSGDEAQLNKSLAQWQDLKNELLSYDQKKS